jgi:hypothetical protein
MKISSNARKLDKTMKEIVVWTHALTCVPLIYFGAGLVPGDRVNLNVLGSVVMIVVFVALDLMITVPCSAWRRRIRRPVLAPVRRSQW